MFVHLSIHYPKPEYERDLIDSMHRYGAAVQGAPGLRHAFTLKDEETGRLVGLMVWDSREQREAAIGRSRAAVENDDFGLWEEREAEGFILDEVCSDERSVYQSSSTAPRPPGVTMTLPGIVG